MLEKFKQFKIQNSKTILGGDAPAGWSTGTINGQAVYISPDGKSWFVIH